MLPVVPQSPHSILGIGACVSGGNPAPSPDVVVGKRAPEGRQASLGMPGGRETPPSALPLARRLMRILRAIIQASVSAVFDTRQHLVLEACARRARLGRDRCGSSTVLAEMSLTALAYNMKRVITMLGVPATSLIREDF